MGLLISNIERHVSPGYALIIKQMNAIAININVQLSTKIISRISITKGIAPVMVITLCLLVGDIGTYRLDLLGMCDDILPLSQQSEDVVDHYLCILDDKHSCHANQPCT